MSKLNPHKTCPYQGLENYQYWRKSMSTVAVTAVAPFVGAPFAISRTDKIATAGSCFAQHVSRYLASSGYNYYVAETAHPIISEKISKKFGYGLFSARYGNIYTSRQFS
jgi:hypothetical protein